MYFDVASSIFVFESKDDFSLPKKMIWNEFSLENLLIRGFAKSNSHC